MQRNRDFKRWSNALDRFAFNLFKTCAQRLVPPNDFSQASFQHGEIEITRETKSTRNIVYSTLRLQPVKKPEPLLREGERRWSSWPNVARDGLQKRVALSLAHQTFGQKSEFCRGQLSNPLCGINHGSFHSFHSFRWS